MDLLLIGKPQQLRLELGCTSCIWAVEGTKQSGTCYHQLPAETTTDVWEQNSSLTKRVVCAGL